MKFLKTSLDNGLRVITVPLKDSPAVTVLVMVEAGSKYETKAISGISHFLEHMCFKGTIKRPHAIDISRELDSIGANYNAFTSQEYTGYYAKSHPKHLHKIMDVISDMYQNPIFSEKEIEKEKGVIIEEINMYEDMPNHHVQDIYNELLYGDQPAGWNIAGTKNTVSSITREHFLEYRSKHYVSSATTVVIAGDFDEADIMQKVTDMFRIENNPKQPKEKVKESQDKPQIRAHTKETDQVHLVLGARSFDVYHPDAPALRVLNAILGGGMSSRLFHKLRDEMGVGYYVRSSIDEYTDHGSFKVSTGVDTRRVKEVIAAILSELKKVRDAGVPEAELQKAKDYLVGSMYLDLESSDAIAGYYGIQEVLRERVITPDELAVKLGAVTAADVERVAQQIFTDNHLNLALIGSTQKEDIQDVFSFNA